MLKITTNNCSNNCEGTTRRDFISLGAAGLFGLLGYQNLNAEELTKKHNKTIVFLWLDGGASQVESFNPVPNAPEKYTSATGVLNTSLPGFQIGGTFPKIAEIAKDMAFIRSFGHTNSGHSGGTHFVTTGYDNKQVDNGGSATKPSVGSIIARYNGINNQYGVPNYIKLTGKNVADGAAFLGPAYAPFNPNGEAKKNLELTIGVDRLDNRKDLFSKLDRLKQTMDASGHMDGISHFQKESFNTIQGDTLKAFDIQKESEETFKMYGGRYDKLGPQLILARRLAEHGTGFVSIAYGGWDMHSNIKTGMEERSPSLDAAVSGFVRDIKQRGMEKNVLLVVCGEFGRTPINNTAGRDHWPQLSPLALFGGGYKMGQVIGKSDNKGMEPDSKPYNPQNLMSTMFDFMSIPKDLSFADHSGRPTYMIEHYEPIKELS